MLEFFEPYDAARLRYLFGGSIRGNDYFIAILREQNIEELFFGRLINNFQSQKQPVSHPAGYLPFAIAGESWNFDLATQTFGVRKLSVTKTFQGRTFLYRSTSRLRAVVLKTPPAGSESLLVAQRLWHHTLLREQVRRACNDHETLLLVTDLLQETWLRQRPAIPTLHDPVTRFEFYLGLATEQTLTDLVALVQPTKVMAQVA